MYTYDTLYASYSWATPGNLPPQTSTLDPLIEVDMRSHDPIKRFEAIQKFLPMICK